MLKNHAMDFDAVAGELYGADPEQFVLLRKQRASEARASGDRDLARRITALRKPTRPAWIVNLLSGQASAELDDLLALGAALAEAQQRLSAAELRELSGQRHAAIAALVRRAAQLAQVHGHSPSDSTLREVSDTLQAALSDPSVAETVRRGRLSEAQEYGGFGPAFGATAAAGAATPPTVRTAEAHESTRASPEADGTDRASSDRAKDQGPDEDRTDDAGRPDDDAERDRLIDRLNTAQQALDRVRDEQRRNEERRRQAQTVADQRSQRVDHLRRQLESAEREAQSAAEDLRQLHDRVHELRTAEGSAEDAVADALSQLADH